MKIALCFIINYEHVLNKELIWREWIEPNKDIINVYFYYKDLKKIKSKWIMEHTLPPNYIHETSYFHVIPAYLSVMNFAASHDAENMWFCMLTDSCCPIISPKRFRYMFFKYYNKSIFAWKPVWWDPNRNKRGNTLKLPKEYWIGNDPWFTLTRENVAQISQFVQTKQEIVQLIDSGGLANESLFAVIFYWFKEIGDHEAKDGVKKNRIICMRSHLADWERMSSDSSPHIFKTANKGDIAFIEKSLKSNPYAMFIRKMAVEFPDEVLRYYIYKHNEEEDTALVVKEPLGIGKLMVAALIALLLAIITFL